jgi:glutamyl-tRNA(Gln) amidotransferase subunit E
LEVWEGLRVGIELHQQLDSPTKLFCACPPRKSEELPGRFTRRLRPAQSEMGRLDPAAVFEYSKAKTSVYLWSPESSCLVEADEEPPHKVSGHAFASALVVALLLGSEVVDEVHVMRKIVIDGSNTSGFQRTAVVGLGGSVDVDGTPVGVQSVTLEEDAARVVGEDGGSRTFAIDRLGVPLVEVALDPIEGSPELAGKAALHLGRALRSTGRVARGLGTVRQDLNVSLRGGEVVEVKGVQKLNLVPKVVLYEAKRQDALRRVSEELSARGLKTVVCKRKEVSRVLSGTRATSLAEAIRKGGKVECIAAEGLSGMLGAEPHPGMRLGKELAEVARANGLGGVVHSDEFEKQGVSGAERRALVEEMGVGAGAGLVLLAGPAERLAAAAAAVALRLQAALGGAPAETRSATEEGETRYMRPRPGAQRMYPETDIPEVEAEGEALEEARKLLPERWEERVERFTSQYSLSMEMALKVYDSGMSEGFEAAVSETRVEPSFVATALVDFPPRLAREGVAEGKVTDEAILDVLKAVGDRKLAKEATYEVLLEIGLGRAAGVQEAMKSLGLSQMTEDEVARLVDKVVSTNFALVKEKGEGAFSALMGAVMKEARGRADGAVVSRLLSSRIGSGKGGKAKP